MEDYMIRAIAAEAGVRAITCITTHLVQEGAKRHQTSPAATIALGQALTGATLLGTLLKMRQRVAVKFEGDGPLQKMIVEGNSSGQVRGYVAKSQINIPYSQDAFDITDLLGTNGIITVVKDLRLDDLYEGIVPLMPGSIEQNFTHYLNQSEQIPSLMSLGVRLTKDGSVLQAGGILIQALPTRVDVEGIIDQFHNRLQEMPPLSALLHDKQMPEDLLALVLAETDYKILVKRPLSFQCSCSRARSEKALISLGREEIENIMATEGQAIIDCHFCHERYILDQESLQLLLEKMDA